MSQSNPNILVLIPQHVYGQVISPETEKLLHSFANVRRAEPWKDKSEDELNEMFEGIDGVLTSWGVHPFPGKAFLASDNVKILSHAAGGVRWVPREALEKGIIITNASEAMSPRISEMCLTYALMGLHNVQELLHLREKISDAQPFFRRRLIGKTVGMVGFGWIARNFAKYLAPFDVKILAYDPYVSDEILAGHGAERADLERIFRESAVVSIHAGATDETRGMIDAKLLKSIQDSAVFINTARGPVVDHDALTEELRKGRFVAYLDVTDPEPLPADHPLNFMPNVMLSGHKAGSTDEPVIEVGDAAVGELKRYFSGEPLKYEVKMEWYDRMT
ncbi:MAG: hydroxyacid dehydrogenase [Armatimonadota bacterium]|nr:hydroxyacid dehydrogenase [Armatimonadota bacterium]